MARLPAGHVTASQKGGGEQGEGRQEHFVREEKSRGQGAEPRRRGNGQVTAQLPEGVQGAYREQGIEGEVQAGDALGADGHAAYEVILMGKLSGLPAVLRLKSSLTMKEIERRP
jgi:hypothetical protein